MYAVLATIPKENYRPVADSFKEKTKRSMLYVESIKQSGISCIGRLKEDITVSRFVTAITEW